MIEKPENPPSGALTKAATVGRYYPVKHIVYGTTHVLYKDNKVGPNQTLSAWTVRPANSTVDPIIVAYHLHDNTDGMVDIVGLNDDFGPSLDSHISWTNRTGADVWIHTLAFAYLPGVSGTGTFVSIVNDNSDPVISYGGIAGYVQYDNNVVLPKPAPGCVGPLSDKINLTELTVGGLIYESLLVNAHTMTGAVLYTFNQSQFETLPDPTPSGYPNFLLRFGLFPPYGDGSEGTNSAWQYQKYSCPQ